MMITIIKICVEKKRKKEKRKREEKKTLYTYSSETAISGLSSTMRCGKTQRDFIWVQQFLHIR